MERVRKVLSWVVPGVVMAAFGVLIVFLLYRQEASTHEREAQQEEIAALQAAVDEANDRLTDQGEDPVDVPDQDTDVVAVPGPTGPPGPSGQRGPAGKDGTHGDDGTDGHPGQDGMPGARGSAGVSGTDGEDGASGPPGADGQAGPQGDTGPQGPPGKDGHDGKDGADGADGATGPPGPPGAPGPTCPDGIEPQPVDILTRGGGVQTALVCIAAGG